MVHVFLSSTLLITQRESGRDLLPLGENMMVFLFLNRRLVSYQLKGTVFIEQLEVSLAVVSSTNCSHWGSTWDVLRVNMGMIRSLWQLGAGWMIRSFLQYWGCIFQSVLSFLFCDWRFGDAQHAPCQDTEYCSPPKGWRRGILRRREDVAPVTNSILVFWWILKVHYY